jgi:hypothetical protein
MEQRKKGTQKLEIERAEFEKERENLLAEIARLNQK